ncbi:FAD-binding domain-containing protein [Plenodomus tracheiphilus IPT5]|uniref:FAD-binding domain-containing protein n=1 Tax=Plenodomus tracheiphilus IPT5 TaxID=1408161 RepID=A0A6A7B6I4_9PLEO|nr:FAD-binding domain-containing protein [Plenodomus tracheiphilus IPT5]
MAILRTLQVLAALALAADARSIKVDSRCRNIPGDAGWPSEKEWQYLNATVEGRLVATVPLGSVCHTKGDFAAYDAATCATLGEPIRGEIMNPYFQNVTCSAFTPANDTCALGARAVYSIDVRQASDVQAGLKFARQKNIRTVVKSTGIDYMGKSTGLGSLSLWTWNLKTINIISNYSSPSYKGSAIKLGPGVIAGEAYAAAAQAGVRFVGPECGLTGIAGGYVQGGGHSQLSSAYGLAADQVLEWEVVTPAGDYLIATPEKNTDLYFALSGGGGGTYGVVLSMTAKAYPEGPVAGGLLVFPNTNATAYWDALESLFSRGPGLVEGTANNVQFAFTKDTFLGFSITVPNKNSSALNALIAPFLGDLDGLGIAYQVQTFDSASYAEHYVKSYGPLPYGNLCPSYVNLASRLIPRATALDTKANANLISTFRSIVADGNFTIGCSFLDVQNKARHPNAVLPAWRDALSYCNPQSTWAFNDTALSLAAKNTLVAKHIPALEAATPGSGSYLNEMDPLYKGDWKKTMYGANYNRLLKIKRKYDPHHQMYAKFAVGSDEFSIDQSGRLC